MQGLTGFDGLVMFAEAVSSTFLHCVLKGLHRSPKIVSDKEGFWQRGVLMF